MNHIEPLTSSIDLGVLAHNLSELLSHPSNGDIAAEFPGSVKRYTGDVESILANLEDAIADCREGVRQQFIAYSGEHAVGMSVIRFADQVPECVDASWPNVSGFICNPFRNQGIGKLSLLTRISVIERQFGGNAWTKVRRDNASSHALVRYCGFMPIAELADSTIYKLQMVK